MANTDTYNEEEPNTDNVRIWGGKCYAYVDPKTRHKDDRHDKLMLRGREDVFMKRLDDTDRHLRMCAPDLGYFMRSSRLIVAIRLLGGDIDLKLKDYINGS